MGQDAEDLGHYEGTVRVEWLSDGRLVRLLEPLSFIDSFTMRWNVPGGWKVDGASIPQALWSIVGSPFTGLYRDASVVHDYFCDTKSRPWGAVHRVFYDAMRASGVGRLRAKLMYAAVCWGGPRWREQVVFDPSPLDQVHFGRHGSNRVHQPFLHDDPDSIRRHTSVYKQRYRFPLTELDVTRLNEHLEANELHVTDIPEFVEDLIKQSNIQEVAGD